MNILCVGRRSREDHVIPRDEQIESGRVAVFVNGYSPEFISRVRVTVTIRRGGLDRPVYMGSRSFRPAHAE
jgi:hypothetical protein